MENLQINNHEGEAFSRGQSNICDLTDWLHRIRVCLVHHRLHLQKETILSWKHHCCPCLFSLHRHSLTRSISLGVIKAGLFVMAEVASLNFSVSMSSRDLLRPWSVWVHVCIRWWLTLSLWGEYQFTCSHLEFHLRVTLYLMHTRAHTTFSHG